MPIKIFIKYLSLQINTFIEKAKLTEHTFMIIVAIINGRSKQWKNQVKEKNISLVRKI